jgi:hypothetical protein
MLLDLVPKVLVLSAQDVGQESTVVTIRSQRAGHVTDCRDVHALFHGLFYDFILRF